MTARRHLTGQDVIAIDQDPHDRLVTLREASRILLVNPRTIGSWVACGRVPYAVVGGRIVVPLLAASDVEHDTRTSRRGRPRRVAC